MRFPGCCHRPLRPPGGDRGALILLLRQRGRLSAVTLARELEVSVRTVQRDFDALSSAGVPVFAERGRYGRYELLPGFRAELTGMSAEEAAGIVSVAGGQGRRTVGLA
ncbi:helix-turn-helix transcriptional regulator [Leucobacter sp. M11]|uniref:helix-turn-helix transcriptional regulator n=1 Tax=Leucobacter sp. M11 TaxID=2993565 RepID=UPI002D7E64E1|nr:HTH domain-containing protein [Leucobacter sp. M11]MEB4616323.1 HTH domain-containing protein [Leucobacter sp. M11]